MHHPPKPDRLILDGQQRLTSLFQSLFSGHPVLTKDVRVKSIHRWYYLDINKSLDPNIDREEAIISLPTDRVLRNFRGEVTADYSTTEKECEAELLPFSLVFDTVGLLGWSQKHLQAEPDRSQERFTRWGEFLQVIQSYQQYQIPVISLRRGTPKVAICQVFEKVNHGQKILSVRDLPYQTQITALAAIFAVLSDRSDHVTIGDKLKRWYWCGVFGELYGRSKYITCRHL